MKTILVLTDFSIRAQYAARFALQIATKLQANILLGHAMEIVENSSVSEPVAWPIAGHIALKQECLTELNDMAIDLESSAQGNDGFKPTISCFSEFGKLSTVASKIVNEKSVDMIVIGSHKSNSLARFLLGSHTHDVLDNVNCSVLLVPETLKYKEFSSIAYATDLTFSDYKVINYLALMAKPFGAEIRVSHISPYGLAGNEDDKAILHSINEQLAEEHPKVLYSSIKGDNISKRLLDITNSGKVDILVLVHKRYGFFESLFHSSVSKQLANNVNVPLLILPYSFSIDVADISNEQLDHFCYEPNDSR